MINPIKIYVEQEEQVNLLFQQQQEQLKAITKTLEGKIGGVRIPVPDGSLTDITFNVKRAVTIEKSMLRSSMLH
jgi:glyceraldehyde-3-phosphate dehydrogenase/erythrose-4-phosphate dehydrogenase